MACAATTSDSSTSVTPAKDPVDFIVLGRGNRTDCGGRRADGTPCRIRDNVSIPEIRRRLGAGTAVWREGDALVFAYEGKTNAVDVIGTVEYPMSRVRGTDLWVLKLRVPELDRAIVSYRIVPLEAGMASPPREAMPAWRGPRAPPEALKSVRLQGRVVTDTIDSRVLGDARTVHIYLPADGGSPEGVVYLGDGGAVHALAPYVDTLIAAKELVPVMLVGLASAEGGPAELSRRDPRALEYLWNYDTLNSRFLAHERFLLDEVIPWAESRYGAPPERGQRAVFGVSNSGGWAMQMGLRHPDRFAHVIAFSPGGVRSGHMNADMRFAPPVRFLLLAGSLEPVFERVARTWVDELEAKGVEHRLIEVVAGHDWNVWRNEFGGAVQWAFGRRD